MTRTVKLLRSPRRKLPRQVRLDAANRITQLTERVDQQQTIMNAAAGLLAEAMYSDDGIDSTAGEQCVNSIRGAFEAVGKTTHEHFLEKLYDRIAAAAGIRAGEEFNPLHVLDQIRVVLSAQSQNAMYLNWALDILWQPGSKDFPPALITNTEPYQATHFPQGTTWMQALDSVLAPPPRRQPRSWRPFPHERAAGCNWLQSTENS